MTTFLNARILASLGMIVFVAAIAASSTGAFYSDSETSTGNTFTAGDIDLRIDNTSYITDSSGVLVASPANSWTISDLTDQLFFSFADVKPGDIGEDTISIHPGSNDAYACMAADITATPDNGINEPESDAGDITAGDGGELQSFLNFSFWEDDGDNVFEDGEALLPDLQGSAAAIFDGGWNTIADSGNGPALDGGSTSYVGKAWCFGTLTPNGTTQDGVGTGTPLTRGTTGFTCDGSGNNNIAQTDGINVDVSFYAVQARNNGEFLCADLPEFVGQGGDEEVVVASSYTTGFEPGESFILGNINGQSGWKKTGSFDSEIENTPVISDVQSLRISNAVTSGSFGDQTFAPDLALGAGETGVGDAKNHYEAQFDIKSTQAAHQPGLVLSVSPDDGNGARMSYLRFEDQADGIHVFFSEVTNAGPIGTVSSFSSEDIATIDRTSAHTIKFVMDFVDGPGNDVVKIYVDGVLKKTGTSWENYYRFDPEQTGGGNLLSEVDTLIFRAGGTAAPATAGNGFLFDKVSLLSGTI